MRIQLAHFDLMVADIVVVGFGMETAYSDMAFVDIAVVVDFEVAEFVVDFEFAVFVAGIRFVEFHLSVLQEILYGICPVEVAENCIRGLLDPGHIVVDTEVVLFDIEYDVVDFVVVVFDIGFVVAVKLVPVAEVPLQVHPHLGRNLRSLLRLDVEYCCSEKKKFTVTD